MQRLLRFLRDDEGATVIEYSVMLSLIIGIAIIGIRSFGSVPSASLNNSSNQLAYYMNGS